MVPSAWRHNCVGPHATYKSWRGKVVRAIMYIILHEDLQMTAVPSHIAPSPRMSDSDTRPVTVKTTSIIYGINP